MRGLRPERGCGGEALTEGLDGDAAKGAQFAEDAAEGDAGAGPVWLAGNGLSIVATGAALALLFRWRARAAAR